MADTENEVLLFVYGTLLSSLRQKKLLKRIPKSVVDALPGYACSEIEVEGETYPAAVPDAFSSVPGRVLSITTEELSKLDEYETEAYVRKMMPLKSGLAAWVYCPA